nr:MAG TPA: hypothetical protein [Caudoviricetes sp.]
MAGVSNYTNSTMAWIESVTLSIQYIIKITSAVFLF